MKKIAVAFAVLLTSCVSIPKPDWNPGDTPPAPQTKGERQTCPLPAQWGWDAKYKQWVCAPVSACYWPTYYGYYYGPPAPYFRGGYCL